MAGALGLLVGLILGGLLGFAAARRPEPTLLVEPDPLPVVPPPAVPVPRSTGTAAEAAFDAALDRANEAGFAPRLPDGASLARQLASGDDGARAVALTLEKAARRSLRTLDDAFARQLPLAWVWEAAAELAEENGCQLIVEAPKAVGPRDLERWLVDEGLARRWKRLGSSGVIQPVLVVRPTVLRGDTVLLEGVVV